MNAMADSTCDLAHVQVSTDMQATTWCVSVKDSPEAAYFVDLEGAFAYALRKARALVPSQLDIVDGNGRVLDSRRFERRHSGSTLEVPHSVSPRGNDVAEAIAGSAFPAEGAGVSVRGNGETA